MAKQTDSKKTAPKDRDIQSVSRALEILETIAAAGELGVTEIAHAVGLHVATVHNILRTLSRHRYLENRGGRYCLGVSAAMLSGAGAPTSGLSAFCQPWLARLSRETGEATSVSVLSGEVLQIVAFQPGTHAITVHFPKWIWPQPLCLATGRLLVADLPEERWSEFVREGESPRPDWSVDDWDRDLRGIRNVGYCALTHSDQGGQMAIGFPVRSRSGHLLAGVGASAPTLRVTPDLCTRMFAAIRTTAVEMSRELGCPPERLETMESAEIPDWQCLLP